MSESLITKKALAASVKELMGKHSLTKISVSDIVQNCGLNRQTFYYHFKDKYDLVNWIYYDEVVSPFLENSSLSDLDADIRRVLLVMERDKAFYIGALNLSGQNAFREYLFDITKQLISRAVDALDSENRLPRGDREFIAKFCTHGLVGIIEDWAKSGMKESSGQLADHLRRVVDDNTLIAIQRAIAPYNREQAGK